MVKRKKDPESARKKAAGRAYTEEVNADAKPWLTKYLANKEIVGTIPVLEATPKEADSILPRLEKDYKVLYESALKRIEELEKRLRKRIAKKDSKTPGGFGRGPKSVVPGGQPANATRKPKKHFSRQTNPYKD
jgi:guanyl-specific ribonuclease Sa